jgi:hypothetical protein
MKNQSTTTNSNNIRSNNNNKHRPEVRDNLDSRKNEEQDFKGDDTTHNAKPHHNKHPQRKK